MAFKNVPGISDPLLRYYQIFILIHRVAAVMSCTEPVDYSATLQGGGGVRGGGGSSTKRGSGELLFNLKGKILPASDQSVSSRHVERFIVILEGGRSCRGKGAGGGGGARGKHQLSNCCAVQV